MYILPTKHLLQIWRHTVQKSGNRERYSTQGEMKTKLKNQNISDRMGFKMNTVTRDKEVHYLMTKGSNQEGVTAIVNLYAPNIGAS